MISEVFSDVAKIWDYSFIGKSNHRNMIHIVSQESPRRVSEGEDERDTVRERNEERTEDA